MFGNKVESLPVGYEKQGKAELMSHTKSYGNLDINQPNMESQKDETQQKTSSKAMLNSRSQTALQNSLNKVGSSKLKSQTITK